MKNVFKTLAVLLTLFSLTGCGLKGRFISRQPIKRAAADEKVDSQTQSTMPDKNDRATGDGPSRSITEDSFLSPRERSE